MRPTRASLAARAVAALGLPTELPLPGGELTGEAWLSLLMECQQHRVVGLLALGAEDGVLRTDARGRQQLVEAVRSWAANHVRVEQMLVRAVRALDAHAIETRVLKGVAMAHTAYPDPALRTFADADLLVGAGRFAEAATVLAAEMGATRVLGEMRPGFDERFGREILVKVGSLELDLHRTFVDGVYGMTIVVDDLFDDARWFELAGHRLPTLGPAAQFVHACYSAVLGNATPRLMAQRDVLQLGMAEGFDVGEALGLARRWRAEGVVVLAVRESLAALGVPGVAAGPLAEVGDTSAGWRDRLVVPLYRNRFRGRLAHASGLLGIRGFGPRLRYSRALIRPQRSYRNARADLRGRP